MINEQTVITLKELAERWGLAPNSVRKMEQEGKLHRLPDLPGVRFSLAEVIQIETLPPETKALTVWERKRMQDEIDDLRNEVKTLRERLLKILSILQGF